MSIKITIYGKNECCLCEKAKELARKVAVDFPLVIEEVDITTDAELWDKYRESIPVIALNGRIVFRGKVAELWLRRELHKLGV